jgi:hypothetical protein
MKILVLSFYYKPDLSAGSFRTTALTEDLATLAPAGSSIEVITTLPNRYHTFAADAPSVESRPGLTIRRIAVGAHKSGMADQSRAFLRFASGARRATSGKRYDLVFATSSRLMTAALGAHIAGRTGARLYLDIRDIFVDTIKDVLKGPLAKLMPPAFSILERRTITAADTVNLVSPGFASYFGDRYPHTRFTFFTNGIDDEFVVAAPAERSERPTLDSKVRVLYAGNVGEGQGLHAIVPRLAARLRDRVEFTIIGDGGRHAVLDESIRTEGLANVKLIPPMDRARLIEAYRAADVLFLHLNDYPAFEKVLPSKVFEYGAMGKPIWAGLGGFSAAFVERELQNSAVFPPGNADTAIVAFDRLKIRDEPRTDFIAKYSRADISLKMAADILSAITRSG